MKHKTNQTGMTLIEIMVALLIGAFLLGGVLQIFTGSQQTYLMQQNLSRLQENGSNSQFKTLLK
jgi:type IV pilus assembly protein PilW